MDDLKTFIREVPDYPKPGIQFRDITTLLQDPVGMRLSVEHLVEHFADREIDKVAGRLPASIDPPKLVCALETDTLRSAPRRCFASVPISWWRTRSTPKCWSLASTTCEGGAISVEGSSIDCRSTPTASS